MTTQQFSSIKGRKTQSALPSTGYFTHADYTLTDKRLIFSNFLVKVSDSPMTAMMLVFCKNSHFKKLKNVIGCMQEVFIECRIALDTKQKGDGWVAWRPAPSHTWKGLAYHAYNSCCFPQHSWGNRVYIIHCNNNY